MNTTVCHLSCCQQSVPSSLGEGCVLWALPRNIIPWLVFCFTEYTHSSVSTLFSLFLESLPRQFRHYFFHYFPDFQASKSHSRSNCLLALVFRTTLLVGDVNVYTIFTVVETKALRDKQLDSQHAVDLKLLVKCRPI